MNKEEQAQVKVEHEAGVSPEQDQAVVPMIEIKGLSKSFGTSMRLNRLI